MYETTRVAPVGKVCNIKLYNNGSWGSYDQLVGCVNRTMSTCRNKWVTQAFIEVTGRVPSQAECDIKRYGNGS